MKKIQVGVIGLGHQGIIHLSNSLRLKNDCDVVAVADTSELALAKVRQIGINTYLNYREMMDKEKMDAVIISIPNYLHEDCCLLASEYGYDIFLEKPLATNIDVGRHIANSVKKSNINLMIGMNRRFLPNMQKLKQIVDEGTIGHVEHASAILCASPFWSGAKIADWWFDISKTGGGTLIDNGCHIIDILLWFFGDVKSVNGYLEYKFNLDCEDYSELSLRFKNGTNACAVTSWRTRFPIYSFEIIGQSGKRRFVDTNNPFDNNILYAGLSFVSENILNKIKGRSMLPFGGNSYYNELKYFMDCIIKDEKPMPNVDDGIKVLDIISGIYKSRGRHNIDKT